MPSPARPSTRPRRRRRRASGCARPPAARCSRCTSSPPSGCSDRRGGPRDQRPRVHHRRREPRGRVLRPARDVHRAVRHPVEPHRARHGLLLGLVAWGVVRYAWVLAKLALLVGVILVGALVLGPGTEAMRSGRRRREARLIAASAYDVVALSLATGVRLQAAPAPPEQALTRSREHPQPDSRDRVEDRLARGGRGRRSTTARARPAHAQQLGQRLELARRDRRRR